jgi:hypothetical protein
MAGDKRPESTWISNVFNPGIDKTIPTGFVDVVYDRATGEKVGYMQNGNFYPLGVDAVTYDKQKEENPTFFGAGLGNRPAGPQGIQGEILTKGLAVTTDTSGTYVGDTNGNEVFIYLSTKADAKGDYQVNVTNDYDAIRRQILSEANSTPGGIDGLFSSLFNAGLISKDVFNKKDMSDQQFNKGLAYAVRNYSVKTIDSLTIGGQKQVGGFIDFLGKGAGLGGPTTDVTYNSVTTTRQDAAEELNRYFVQYFGFGATKEQEDAYYLALRELEKANVQKISTTTDGMGNVIGKNITGQLVSDVDRFQLFGKIAGKAIKNTNLEKVINGGANITEDVNDLIAYANSYGISLSAQEAIDYVGQNLKKGLTVEVSKNKILKLAQTRYANIGTIDEDITVADIANPFKTRLSTLTGLSLDSIPLTHPLIQKALSNNGQKGTMLEADFDKLVKTDPETRQLWLNQPGTKDEAAQYLLNILQSFRLVA